MVQVCAETKTVRSIMILMVLAGLLFVPALAGAADNYLSTGFGITNREPHPEYSLKLVFSTRSGKYLADIQTQIYRDGQKIKEIFSPGPWLFVDLPPGKYRVVASTDDGQKQGARFSLEEGEDQRQVILAWPY